MAQTLCVPCAADRLPHVVLEKMRGLTSSKSEAGLRMPGAPERLGTVAPVPAPVAESGGYPPRRPSSMSKSRTNSGRLSSPQDIDHPWETCPFRTLFLVIQDMMALKYGLQLDEPDFVGKAKARCGDHLEPGLLAAALNAEPALKVKDAGNERLVQLRLRVTTMSSFWELQGYLRRWPGTACALAAVGLAGPGRNVQLVAPFREAYGARESLVAKARPKIQGGVGPLQTFGQESFSTAVVLEPVIEHVLRYQPQSNAMMELQTPVECPEFRRSAAAFNAEVSLAERFCGALAALAPASADRSATASCLLAKELMTRHPDVADMQIAGCRVLGGWLRQCADSFSVHQACATMEALTAAMRRHSAHPAVQEAAAAALSLGDWPELQAAASTNGAVEEVVAAMRRFPGDPELQASACAALAGLASNHLLNQSSIMACGSIEVILTAMVNFPQHVRLQSMACGALGNLAAKNPNNQAAVASAGGLQRVVAALHAHHGRCMVATAALGALWHLAKRHHVNREAAGRLGVVELATAALQRYPDDRGLKIAASGVLQCLVPGLAEALAGQVGLHLTSPSGSAMSSSR
ncbi:unnamed protein product [Effrenium voratum]|uniref:Uncharacterized protein n=1 Tax=Effrenium voratum TaxID=2562239 RepID=A0AA36NKR2_9DINO|nr:unnamed protein product [Effrenium voratum]